MTPTRRALTVAGVATLGMSLVLSIAPALAASGTVKIFDGETGDELGNNPHVCSFYAAFFADDPPETGTWQLLDWGGDHSIVDSGTYDTTGDGQDVTGVLSPDPGHYRFEWRSTADSTSKNKMLWVDAECAQASDPSDESSPSDEASPSQESSASDESSPSQESSPSDGSSPSQESSASDESSPSQESSPSVEPDPSQVSEPSDDPQPSDNPDPSTEPVSEPEQEVQPGNPPSNTESGSQENTVGPATGNGPMLPDTAIPVTQSGVLATIGLLLIIAAHAGTRRQRSLPTA